MKARERAARHQLCRRGSDQAIMSARYHRPILSSFDALITELRLVRRTLVRSSAELHFSCDQDGMISDNFPVLATETLLPSYTISYSKVQDCLSSHWTTPTLQSAQVTVHSRKIEAARHTHDLTSLPTSSHQQIPNDRSRIL